MSRQSGAASESLLTIGVRAFVGTLARVDSTMACQGTAVAKWLAAAFTHVRFLSRVNSLMNSEGRTLDELLATVGEVADVRANTAMNAFVAGEITASSKALAAGTARVGLRGLLRRLLVRGLVLRHALGHVVLRDAGQDHGAGSHVGDRHLHLHWSANHGAGGWVGTRNAFHGVAGVLGVFRAVRGARAVHGRFGHVSRSELRELMHLTFGG